MKNKLFRAYFLGLCIVVFSVGNSFAQKLDVTEIVAKHRASIGAPDAVGAVKNQMIVTDAKFTYRGMTQTIAGKALFLSAGDKSLVGMEFASNDYPRDRFGYDGKSVKIGRATPNTRSLLGVFLYDNREILKEGLLGGTLTSAWPLLRDGFNNAKVKLDGTKTIDGVETYALSFAPKASSGLDIKIYIDAKTFRHVRTEYVLIRNAAQGTSVDSSAGQSGATYRLVEDFSNYSKMGQLNLPREYKVLYARSGTAPAATVQSTNRDAMWSFVVTDIGFNRELDANSFDIDAK